MKDPLRIKTPKAYVEDYYTRKTIFIYILIKIENKSKKIPDK